MFAGEVSQMDHLKPKDWNARRCFAQSPDGMEVLVSTCRVCAALPDPASLWSAGRMGVLVSSSALP